MISFPSENSLDVNAGMSKKLEDFHSLINGFIARKEELTAFELAQEVIKESGISVEAYSDLTPEGMSRSQNIQELLNAIDEFVTTRQEEGVEEIQLIDFLSEVSLLTDQDTNNDEDAERVTLMTVHSAKGLEFGHVFVVGMEEDLFPSAMVKNEMRGLEEERRLFYVALTRAKKTCTITYARSRFKNGQTNAARESRFIKEIDAAYVLMESNVGTQFSNSERTDDFWGSMREKRLNRDRKFQREYTPSSGLVSINNLSSPTPLSEEAKELEVGHIIEHERFGRGEVTAIELNGNDRRAFVDFESAGKKQLLLKFAKFKITGKI